MRPPRSLSLAALVVVVSACTGAGGPVAPSRKPAQVVSPVASLPATVDELPFMDVSGYEALLGELRGVPLVVNFWATWCNPCQAEAPRFAVAAARYGDLVQFLGVDILDDRGDATIFIADHAIPYPNVFDPFGAIRNEVASIGQPVTVFYDAQGNLVAKVAGEISQTDLDAHLAAIAR